MWMVAVAFSQIESSINLSSVVISNPLSTPSTPILYHKRVFF